jgi:hypothetical protein
MAAVLDPRVAALIHYADPDESRTGMVLATDLMEGRVEPAFLELALRKLEGALADSAVTTADLKGALNRASDGTWGMEYDRIFTPREFLEALRGAVEAYLLRRPGVPG